MGKERLQDFLAGHDGKATAVVNGRILPLALIGKITANITYTTESKRFLGERMTQHAIRGAEGTGSITYYPFQSTLIKIAKQYKETGEIPDINIQFFNEGSTRFGRGEVLLRNVIINAVSLGILDDTMDESISQESDITFDDFEIISEFNEIEEQV